MYKYLLVIFSVLAFGLFHSVKANEVEIKCFQINRFGDVSINWNEYVGGNNFLEYELYFSTDGNTFSQVYSSTTVTQINHIHTGANANIQPVFYYVKTKTDSAILNSDTLQVIWFTLFKTTTGEADLSWKPIQSFSSTLSPYYFIERNIANRGWEVIDSLPLSDSVYSDEISVCGDSISYRISLKDTQFCKSITYPKINYFEDLSAPQVPVIDAVSVDTATGNVVFSWFENSSEDTKGYIVRKVDVFGNIQEYDTVFGINNTFIQDPNSSASLGSEGFAVSAFDSCVNSFGEYNRSEESERHYTMYLTSSYSVCERKIDLSWSRYLSWSSGVAHYNILVSVNNGGFNLVSQNSNTDSIFTIDSLNPDNVYRFVVQAISNENQESFSNVIESDLYYPIRANYVYISAASIEKEGEVEIRYVYDQSAPSISFELYQIESGLDSLLLQYSPVYNQKFIDPNIESFSKSLHYRIVAIDSCGYPGVISNVAKTINVFAQTQNEELTNYVSWNLYEEWDKGGAVQQLYVKHNTQPQYLLEETFDYQDRLYIDNVEETINTKEEGEFCYKILSKEITSQYGTNDSVWSNEYCTYLEPLVWVPNALVQDGYNKYFKPVINYVQLENYLFYIYDRLGREVFSTDNQEEGWNGYIDNVPAQVGLYPYLIEYSAANGKRIEVNGFMNLIR